MNGLWDQSSKLAIFLRLQTWYIDKFVLLMEPSEPTGFLMLSVSGEMQHDLGSSNPGTGEGCLSPILMNWFVERSDDFSTGVEEGQQPSPVSVLDSPLHDEVSTTSEPSLAGHVMVLLLVHATHLIRPSLACAGTHLYGIHEF